MSPDTAEKLRAAYRLEHLPFALWSEDHEEFVIGVKLLAYGVLDLLASPQTGRVFTGDSPDAVAEIALQAAKMPDDQRVDAVAALWRWAPDVTWNGSTALAKVHWTKGFLALRLEWNQKEPHWEGMMGLYTQLSQGTAYSIAPRTGRTADEAMKKAAADFRLFLARQQEEMNTRSARLQLDLAMVNEAQEELDILAGKRGLQ